jgi:hypothetical protein
MPDPTDDAAPATPPRPARSPTGTRVAIAVVIAGLLAAIAGWKFRVFTPRPVAPPAPSSPEAPSESD